MLNIKYINSHNWIGEEFTLKVDEKCYSLHRGPWRYNGKYGDQIDHAIHILKSEYGIVRIRSDVNFIWDGSL